ncbi:hypothetical protein BDY21DRAFT_188677 [Lineolata rhizophorae]|uniref:Uncharacterized protein n=1 Tax=Lineolata rhizophorae TaxID=578093 RepID=A0A6A6P6E7_9PEZI|nr:hypothetical protein BDY21DRAFT_188677 [Lineolata rhizophorae]
MKHASRQSHNLPALNRYLTYIPQAPSHHYESTVPFSAAFLSAAAVSAILTSSRCCLVYNHYVRHRRLRRKGDGFAPIPLLGLSTRTEVWEMVAGQTTAVIALARLTVLGHLLSPSILIAWNRSASSPVPPAPVDIYEEKGTSQTETAERCIYTRIT